MRLGKFIIEYQQALKLINEDSKDEFGRLVSIVLHAIFSFYWALDNLSLMAVFGMINMAEYEFSQSAMTVKLVGMSLAAFFNLRTWGFILITKYNDILSCTFNQLFPYN
ncbi:MAG: hypothetical protein KDD45_06250 [Bdellovibrionales bacterium]|nr:hypothetical protein [Bdellovibrionales bacterium]